MMSLLQTYAKTVSIKEVKHFPEGVRHEAGYHGGLLEALVGRHGHDLVGRRRELMCRQVVEATMTRRCRGALLLVLSTYLAKRSCVVWRNSISIAQDQVRVNSCCSVFLSTRIIP